MQKGKNAQYAVAGVQTMPGIEMNVRSHVWVPDAEAGYETDRTPFNAHQIKPRFSGQAATIPCYAGVLFLSTVLIVCLALVGTRVSRMKQTSDQISAMEQAIVQTIADNSQLTVEVMQAQDSSRICYAAAQELGMVAATGVEVQYVVAPNTRPFAIQTAATENSPFSVGHGTISGSR